MKAIDLTAILNVVRENRLVSDRVIKLRKMGYTVEERPMGSGGVLQVNELRRETRIQIGYGRNRFNYAYAVILKK